MWTMPLLMFTMAMAATPVVEPERDDLCGTYVLYVAAKSLGADVRTLADFESVLGPPPRGGHSLAELAEAAERFPLQTLGVQTTLANLEKRTPPWACIARLQVGHYVLIGQIDGESVLIVDPPTSTRIPRSVFENLWDGNALLISTAPLLGEEAVTQLPVFRHASGGGVTNWFWRALLILVVSGFVLSAIYFWRQGKPAAGSV